MLWPDVKLAIPHTNVTPLFPSECVRWTQHLKFRPESIGPEACTLGTFRTTNLDPIKASERYRENCNDNEDRREERSVCKIMLPPHVQCNAGHECSLNMAPACLCVPLQGRICFVVSKQPSDSRLVTDSRGPSPTTVWRRPVYPGWLRLIDTVLVHDTRARNWILRLRARSSHSRTRATGIPQTPVEELPQVWDVRAMPHRWSDTPRDASEEDQALVSHPGGRKKITTSNSVPMSQSTSPGHPYERRSP